jgi:hypothetical protein
MVNVWSKGENIRVDGMEGKSFFISGSILQDDSSFFTSLFTGLSELSLLARMLFVWFKNSFLLMS